eukprot:Hpha_TRINITY_DN26125_c0_g1::TRINITY_DN26125_c0_g1_i1::g.155478::m.155478
MLRGGTMDLFETFPRQCPYPLILSVTDEAVSVSVPLDSEPFFGPRFTVPAVTSALPAPPGASFQERKWPTHRAVRWGLAGALEPWADVDAPLNFLKRRARDIGFRDRHNVVLIEALHHRADMGPGEPYPPALESAGSVAVGSGVLTGKRVYRVVLATPSDVGTAIDEGGGVCDGKLLRDDMARLVVITGGRVSREQSATDCLRSILRDGDWANTALQHPLEP